MTQDSQVSKVIRSSSTSVWISFALTALLTAAGCQPLQPATSTDPAYRIPLSVPVVEAPRRRIASGLQNPRGVLPRPDGSLLVAISGTGDPATPNSGAILRLTDKNADGNYDAADERKVLLAGLPSANILHIVRRDEVFGVAAISEGRDEILASVAFFGGPSKLYRIDGDEVSLWSVIHGNINHMIWGPKREKWFGVSSSSEEILELQPKRGSRRIRKLPALEKGQDPVPGYLRHDPVTEMLFVSLFSGSALGEEGGDGTEIESGAGGIIAVDPETGQHRWVVRGLTAPTDLLVDEQAIYVLELCDGFSDPVGTREEMWSGTSHGGFRRFSGRLLRIDRNSGDVVSVAEGLDVPTNLAREGSEIFISQGMGTPGRSIPGPNGPQPLEGFIETLRP